MSSVKPGAKRKQGEEGVPVPRGGGPRASGGDKLRWQRVDWRKFDMERLRLGKYQKIEVKGKSAVVAGMVPMTYELESGEEVKPIIHTPCLRVPFEVKRREGQDDTADLNLSMEFPKENPEELDGEVKEFYNFIKTLSESVPLFLEKHKLEWLPKESEVKEEYFTRSKTTKYPFLRCEEGYPPRFQVTMKVGKDKEKKDYKKAKCTLQTKKVMGDMLVKMDVDPLDVGKGSLAVVDFALLGLGWSAAGMGLKTMVLRGGVEIRHEEGVSAKLEDDMFEGQQATKEEGAGGHVVRGDGGAAGAYASGFELDDDDM